MSSGTSGSDLLASLALVLLTGLGFAGHAARGALFGPRLDPSEEDRRTASLPHIFRTGTLEVLGPVARSLAAAGVSANAITACSLLAGIAGGIFLAFGHFGLAAVAVALGSLGDGLDGLVARRTQTASPAGALFDASVDRYEEFFLFGGLAVHFRWSAPLLVAVLAALLGSFMVSYGSAKAEALGVPVPKGIMRRAERAVVLAVGITLVPIAGAAERAFGLPGWFDYAPIVLAVVLVAVLANASAIVRLRAIARVASQLNERALDANAVGSAGEGSLSPRKAPSDRAVNPAE